MELRSAFHDDVKGRIVAELAKSLPGDYVGARLASISAMDTAMRELDLIPPGGMLPSVVQPRDDHRLTTETP